MLYVVCCVVAHSHSTSTMAEDDWESAADKLIESQKTTPKPAAPKSQWDDEDAPEPEPVEPVAAKGPTPAPKKKALSAAKIAAKEREAEMKAAAEAKARASDPKAAYVYTHSTLMCDEEHSHMTHDALTEY